MTNENYNQDIENKQTGCSPCEKGTTMLVVGSGLGLGLYGTASFMATGAVCPACLIFAPVFLGYGAYKRMRFNKAKNGCDTCF